jgi:hypothetical protein
MSKNFNSIYIYKYKYFCFKNKENYIVFVQVIHSSFFKQPAFILVFNCNIIYNYNIFFFGRISELEGLN